MKNQKTRVVMCVCVFTALPRPCLFINHLMFIHTGLCKQVSRRILSLSHTHTHTHTHICAAGQLLSTHTHICECVQQCVRMCDPGLWRPRPDSPLTLWGLTSTI